jgi:hypothetical protein
MQDVKRITIQIPHKTWLNFKQAMLDRENAGKKSVSFQTAALEGIERYAKRGK